MTKIAVFGGTTEGRHIAEFCDKNKIRCSYFAATEAGKMEVDHCKNIEIYQGRLNLEEIISVFNKEMFSVIVDATHPYAVEVSSYIKIACTELGISYLRIIRDDGKLNENEEITYVDTIDDIIGLLNLREGNILITTGSKDAEKYKKVVDYKSRVYIRILPDSETIEKLCNVGFLNEHIITGKGPFSIKENIKAINYTNSKILVTKDSGITGGYYEKIKAANICGCEVVCIRRPKEIGISELEAMKRLSDMVENRVYIIGIGMGNTEFLCEKSKKIINSANVVIGAERMISICKEIISNNADIYISYDTDKISNIIYDSKDKTVVVLMSGDTGFFSGAKKLMKKLDGCAEIVAGVSSMSYLASKIGVTWEDACAVSMHGRKSNLPFAVLTHEKTFVLTDGKINEIIALLKEYNLADVTVYIGRNLSSEDEKIIKIKPADYIQSVENFGLTCLFIINHNYENRMRFIRDSEFIRNDTPMTKDCVRNQIISRFNVKKDSVIYDIGAGTGSISLMLARLVPNGRVYAFDVSQGAIEVLEKNKRKFSTDHIECVLGEAPEIIEQNNIPVPDAVFIGGSKGNIKDITDLFEGKKVPFVMTVITIETYCEVMNLIDEGKIKSAEITQLFITNSVKLGDRYHFMSPQNPVWLISGVL